MAPWGKAAGKGKGKGKGAGQWVFLPAVSSYSKGGKSKGKGKAGKAFNKTMDKVNKVEPELKVWIGGLKKGAQTPKWKDLEKHMEEMCGTKPKITEVMPKGGTAVCTFTSAEEATAAISAANGTDFKGSTLEVDVWEVKEKKAKK
eukprot:TRINITY_DN216_c0_g1_i2.p2 TRINITY_DN216_c0_g1~~TRINITY_DN216_c0_g1_i2.p2  ORF type:complete len:161 (-),score=50.58 TRINITY_DN216_c0_g1_i2:182-616(-)